VTLAATDSNQKHLCRSAFRRYLIVFCPAVLIFGPFIWLRCIYNGVLKKHGIIEEREGRLRKGLGVLIPAMVLGYLWWAVPILFGCDSLF
jgi:hypothetical protein